MHHNIIRKTMLGLGLLAAGVSLTATQAQGKAFITIQPNAAAPADTAYIITVSWEDGFALSFGGKGSMDDKTLLTNSTTTVPSGALAGATIRFADTDKNNDGVDQNSTTTNTTSFFQWDGTDGTTAAAGSLAAESSYTSISGLGSYMSVAETSPLVYGTGVQGVTSLTSHLGIENTALYTSTLGGPFGVRFRNEASDSFGLMMRVDRQLFPQNGLAIISMPYATGSGFTSMFNPGTYTVTDTELVVTTDPTYVPKVFTPAAVDSYATWSGGAAANDDANSDGVSNAVAWALGAADVDENAIGLLPTLDNTSDPTYVVFSFNRSDDAQADPKTSISVEYGTDLENWTTAVDDNDNVEIEVTDASPKDTVLVKLKRSTLGASGKLFARLNVVVTP